MGGTLAILGGGLLLRRGLRRVLGPAAADRLAFTLLGLGLLGLWVLPPTWLEGPDWRQMVLGPEVFFLSGLMLVTGAVLVLMHNGDLLLWALLRLLGGSRRLAAVLRMAVAYPLASRFRTGLTLGIFAVVVFSVIFITAAIDSTEASLGDTEALTGGWDLRLTTSWTNPIRDLPEAISANPRLRASDYAVVASLADVGFDLRQGGGAWYSFYGLAANLDYFQHARIDLRLWAETFDTPADVWRAMQERTGYALIDRRSLAEGRDAPSSAGQRFMLTGVYLEDERMQPARLEVRDPGSGATFFVTVIGVYEPSVSQYGGLLLSQATLDEALPAPPSPTRHFVRLAPGMDRQAAGQALESAFLANGLESVDLLEELQNEQRLQRTLMAGMQGFLTLGLVVGVAALGVISTRAVVERRQQIGMLRALGFRRGMVAASFVLEASFVALLGIGLGMGLALIPAYHLVGEAAGEGVAIPFVVPWRTMAVVGGLAWGMALLTTALPAVQAARVPPAEALRYE
jgi:putative ABC transport system permease protein